MLVGVNFDFNGNEIQNAVVHKLAAAPTALEGKIYYDTVSKTLLWYDGTAWRSVRYINDGGTSTTDLWSADKIQSAIDSAVTAAVHYKGGYNAATNTPDLDVAPSGVKKGDMYTVTAAGTFFTTAVDVGDVIIAEIDSAAAEADWTIVEKNLDGALLSANNLSDVASAVTAFNNIKQAATESATGVAELATQTETDTGTDDTRIVTPLKLTTHLTNKKYVKGFAVNLDSAEGTVARVFAGGNTTYTVTHSLGTLKTHVTVRLKSTEEAVIVDHKSVSTNTTDIVFAGNSADNTYNVYITG